jgi:hypothetical protein
MREMSCEEVRSEYLAGRVVGRGGGFRLGDKRVVEVDCVDGAEEEVLF